MKAETSFDLVGDLIGIDAVAVGPTASVQVKLIVDTAAVMTTLVPRVAESIGYTDALRLAWTVMRTAAGEEHGYLVHSEIAALGFSIAKHRIVIADLGYGIDGLLGMNFLRDFNFEVRPAERRIVVELIDAA